jgi:hypothetical protein
MVPYDLEKYAQRLEADVMRLSKELKAVSAENSLKSLRLEEARDLLHRALTAFVPYGDTAYQQIHKFLVDTEAEKTPAHSATTEGSGK